MSGKQNLEHIHHTLPVWMWEHHINCHHTRISLYSQGRTVSALPRPEPHSKPPSWRCNITPPPRPPTTRPCSTCAMRGPPSTGLSQTSVGGTTPSPVSRTMCSPRSLTCPGQPVSTVRIHGHLLFFSLYFIPCSYWMYKPNKSRDHRHYFGFSNLCWCKLHNCHKVSVT